MSNIVLDPVDMDKTYEDIQLLIYHTVKKFIKHHGGDFDEMVSEANLLFVRMYKGEFAKYDPNKGTSFSTWFRYNLWMSLKTFRNRQIKKQDNQIIEITEPAVYYSDFSISELRQRISAEAKEVLNLILHTPVELLEMIQSTGGRVIRVKKCISNYLKKYKPSYSSNKIFKEIEKEINR
jgi:hypothetical protein